MTLDDWLKARLGKPNLNLPLIARRALKLSHRQKRYARKCSR